MIKLLILIGLLALIFSPAAAHAAYWRPADAATAVRVADAHWPGSPCGGKTAVSWMPSLAADGYRDGTTDADSTQAACTIHVDVPEMISDTPDAPCSHRSWYPVCDGSRPRWDRDRFLCVNLEHEFGHLALGPDAFAETNPTDPSHSLDPSSVMFAGALRTTADCARAFPR